MVGCENASSGGSGDGSNDLDDSRVDSRCLSLCTPDKPERDDAYAICSDESIRSCKEECMERIDGADVICSDGLLKEACFGPYCGESTNVGCWWEYESGKGGCEISHGGRSCIYDTGEKDSKTEDECIREVYPRETVEYLPEYGESSDCVTACN